jgi:hypothetical protein
VIDLIGELEIKKAPGQEFRAQFLTRRLWQIVRGLSSSKCAKNRIGHRGTETPREAIVVGTALLTAQRPHLGDNG